MMDPCFTHLLFLSHYSTNTQTGAINRREPSGILMLSLTPSHIPQTHRKVLTLWHPIPLSPYIDPNHTLQLTERRVQVGDRHLAPLLKCHCELTCVFLNFQCVYRWWWQTVSIQCPDTFHSCCSQFIDWVYSVILEQLGTYELSCIIILYSLCMLYDFNAARIYAGSEHLYLLSIFSTLDPVAVY